MEQSAKEKGEKNALGWLVKIASHSHWLEGCVFLTNQIQWVQIIFDYLRLDLIASISGKLT